MRTVLMGDIVAAARALLAIRPSARADFMDGLLAEAHAAHQFHKRKGKPHPIWGNGSLMARANICDQHKEPFAGNTDYLLALQVVTAGLLARKSHRQ